MTARPETLPELLARGADAAVALAAPDEEPMTYAHLRRLLSARLLDFRRLDVGREDTIALVLPNGPVTAAVFLSAASAAVAAPLHPDYTRDEFEFFLGDLGPSLLVMEAGTDSPARDVAAATGIRIADVVRVGDGPAGAFTFAEADSVAPHGDEEPATPDHIALVLHTSGTTSRNKVVPLSHRNICTSAFNVSTSLSLEPVDRCLNIMPLFHIHGLVAALLGSLSAGASVCCTPGFNALKFFGWMKETHPTWCTAVPTMYHTILRRADRNRDIVREGRLRFLRSCSAPLPRAVMKTLEETFEVPVVEAYGMTEAAHQMTCNPLPPGERRPGTVGLRAGPELAIMDEGGGVLLPRGRVGEVVIRGANVTSGYRGAPEANATAFSSDGWFRTGDQGMLSHDGYLTITGRIKEIINRGGEKLAPRELDEVLSHHPAVAQAFAFPVPHAVLGEEVGAVVTIEADAGVGEDFIVELQAFAAARLAAFKVPRYVVVVDEIPKGPTGKVRRHDLARQLGLIQEARDTS